MRRFRGGLVVKAHRLVYHSTLGSRVIKKKKDREIRFELSDVEKVGQPAPPEQRY